MKRLSFLFSVAAVAVVSMLSSCGDKKEDPKPAPSITAYIGTSGVKSATVASGESATITYSVTTGENIDKIEVTERIGSSTKPVTGFPKTSKFTSSTSDAGAIVVTSTGSEVFYDLKVTDSKGATSSVTITLNPAGAAMTYNSYTAKLLGAQTNAAGAYFASSTGTVYSGTQFNGLADKNIVDITFAEIGATTTVPTLLSSAQRSTETLTTGTGGSMTYFKSSSLNFATVTDAQLAAISASTSQKVTVATNGTYEFVNAAGKKGLINVTALTAGSDATKTNGSVTISVKVQK